MTKKWMLISLVTGLAAIATPSPASAATPVVDSSVANPTSHGTFGAGTLTAAGQQEIQCSGENHYTGSATTNAKNEASTGTGRLLLTNCRFGSTACNSSGKAAGEITTEESVTHLVYINGFTKTVGALFTPNATTGRFAQFSCSFLINVTIAGTGVIAHLVKPACGGTSSSATLSATSVGTGVQTYQEVEGSATKYHLTESINGGAAVEASIDVTVTGTADGGATGTLTCL